MTTDHPRRKLRLPQPAFIAAGYFLLLVLLSQVPLSLREAQSIASWYPPSGLSFALLLAYGPGYIPVVFLSVLATGVIFYQLPFSIYLLMVAGLSALLYGGVAVLLRRHLPGVARFHSLRATAWFAVAAVLSAVLLAAASLSVLVMQGAVPRVLFGPMMFMFWVGDTLGNLTVAPALLVFARPAFARIWSLAEGEPFPAGGALERATRRWSDARSLLIPLGQVLLIALTLWIAFGLQETTRRQVWYLLFLPLVWVILQYGMRGAVLAVLGICTGAVAAIRLFNYQMAGFEDLQMFLLLLALVGLLTGAAFQERSKAERAQRYRLAIEEKLSAISTRFIKMQPERLDEEIRAAMQSIGEFVGVDGGHLLLFGPDRRIRRVFEWAGADVPRRAETLLGWSMERLPWMLAQIERGQACYIPGLDALPADATGEREHFLAHNLRSMITVPLIAGGRLIGSLGFHSVRSSRVWMAEDIRLLSLLADIFLNVLERERVEEQVHESDLKFRSVVLQSSDGVILVDEQSNVIEWNRAMERMTGLRRARVLGRPIYDVQWQLAPDEKRDPALYERIRAHAIQAAQSGDGEWLNRLSETVVARADGERRITQSLLFPVKTAKGWMIGTVMRDVTDLRRGEEALRGSQANLAEAERLAHLGHIRISVKDGKMEWSDEVFRIFERDVAEGVLDLQGCMGYVIAEDRERVLEALQQVLVQKVPFEVTYRVDAAGRWKWVYSIGQPVVDASGEITHIFGTILDIDERTRAEQALRESETRYKELADSISDVFYGVDGNLCCTYWNRASEELTGIPAGRAVGRSLFELAPELKDSTFEQFVQEAFRTQQHQGFVMEYKVRGRRRFMEVNAYPSQNGLSVFLRDVTERQQAEMRLRQSEARYRAVVEDQTDMIARFTPDGTVTFVNEAYCRSVGKGRRELVGRKLIRFGTWLDGKEMTGQRSYRHNGTRAISYESQMVLPDGKAHWIQWTDRPITGGGEQITEYQSVGRDISDSKRLEEELRYLSTHDVLTGIYNRAFFEAEVARLQRSRQYPISVLMADVNGLKSTNDTRGHPAGDELLRCAARVLSASFRPEDIVARFGGDEFGVLLPGTDARAAGEILGRVRANLAAHNGEHAGEPLSLSVGIATGERGAALLEVLTRADERMYEEKERQKRTGGS